MDQVSGLLQKLQRMAQPCGRRRRAARRSALAGGRLGAGGADGMQQDSAPAGRRGSGCRRRRPPKSCLWSAIAQTPPPRPAEAAAARRRGGPAARRGPHGPGPPLPTAPQSAVERAGRGRTAPARPRRGPGTARGPAPGTAGPGARERPAEPLPARTGAWRTPEPATWRRVNAVDALNSRSGGCMWTTICGVVLKLRKRIPNGDSGIGRKSKDPHPPSSRGPGRAWQPEQAGAGIRGLQRTISSGRRGWEWRPPARITPDGWRCANDTPAGGGPRTRRTVRQAPTSPTGRPMHVIIRQQRLSIYITVDRSCLIGPGKVRPNTTNPSARARVFRRAARWCKATHWQYTDAVAAPRQGPPRLCVRR